MLLIIYAPIPKGQKYFIMNVMAGTPGFLELIVLGRWYMCLQAVVGIDSRRDPSIDAHHRNQHNRSKLPTYSPLLHFNSHLVNKYKAEHFSYKGCVVYVGIHI